MNIKELVDKWRMEIDINHPDMWDDCGFNYNKGIEQGLRIAAKLVTLSISPPEALDRIIKILDGGKLPHSWSIYGGELPKDKDETKT